MKESFPLESMQNSSVSHVHQESKLSGQITEWSSYKNIHFKLKRMIQAVGVPIRPVSWKTSAIIEKVVLLASVMLPSSHRDQIVAVKRSYSFVTNAK